MHREDNPDDRNREAADRDAMSYTPGDLDDKETAAARANRTGAQDTTSLRPERAGSSDAGAEGEAEERPEGGEPSPRQPDLGTAADPLR